jgi:glycerol-3-phosphate O-acyltransferase
MPETADRPAPNPGAAPGLVDPLSAMTPRFNLFFRWFALRFFNHLRLEDAHVARLGQLESQGTVVYVMRYASRLDYFLFNTLFLRHGLRLSGFANGIRFYYYRPFWDAVRLRRRRRRLRFGRRLDSLEARRCVRRLVSGGSSLFLFLRTERRRLLRRRSVQSERSNRDLLEEIVSTVWTGDRPVFLVPLALFWRKGPRSERRFLNLAYGAPTRPSDFTKIASFLTTYRGLSVKVGDPIDLLHFVDERRLEGQESIVRKVRRSILVFLSREEKVVEGPALRPLYKVQESVLEDPRVQAAIRERAHERRGSTDAARRDAEKLFREIAAHMNSTFLAILNAIVSTMFRRMFVSIETSGLEKVADYAKGNPIVLVPSHRSYFDFLILSWLFYANYLVPPHIAARENMGFGPFGFIFRRAGAFFLRRNFEDPLYKEVFRSYVSYLVREGFTQEFFIEGARSRTGKTLVPRLGMLSWDVEAFLAGARRDLFFVPVAITYERLVEEGAMVHELEGGKKKSESVIGLVRARRVLKRRWGSAHVSFGEPISLADALGPRRATLASGESEEALAEKRRFVETLGNRLVERINWTTVASATSIAACAFLGESPRGQFRHDLTRRMQEIVDLLRLQDVKITAAVRHDEGDFAEAIQFLLRSDLVRSLEDPRGQVLYFEESSRRALELYRNAILHFLAPPSFMARRILTGVGLQELRDDLGFWLGLFYQEFFTPGAVVLAAQFEAFLDYFERLGVVECQNGFVRATEKGGPYLRFLAEQTRGVIEAYFAAFSSVSMDSEGVTARELQRETKEAFERSRLLGEVGRPEAANPVTFDNAFDVLVRREILVRKPVEGKREVLYLPGPLFDQLPSLRKRLAAALAAR